MNQTQRHHRILRNPVPSSSRAQSEPSAPEKRPPPPPQWKHNSTLPLYSVDAKRLCGLRLWKPRICFALFCLTVKNISRHGGPFPGAGETQSPRHWRFPFDFHFSVWCLKNRLRTEVNAAHTRLRVGLNQQASEGAKMSFMVWVGALWTFARVKEVPTSPFLLEQELPQDQLMK